MGTVHLSRWVEGGRRVVVRLLGTFDGAAARDLLDHIHAESTREVVIDVALVRGFDEVGLAALARLVESSDDCRISLRGLSTHQLRILRYLGTQLSRLATGSEQ